MDDTQNPVAPATEDTGADTPMDDVSTPTEDVENTSSSEMGGEEESAE
jgi:hypothetical protein